MQDDDVLNLIGGTFNNFVRSENKEGVIHRIIENLLSIANKGVTLDGTEVKDNVQLSAIKIVLEFVYGKAPQADTLFSQDDDLGGVSVLFDKE